MLNYKRFSPKLRNGTAKKIFWNQHLFNFEQHVLPTKSMTFLKNLTELRLLLSIFVHLCYLIIVSSVILPFLWCEKPLL